MVIETGLFGLHKVCITAMKIYYSKQNHTIIHYAKLKDFNNEAFIKDLKVVSWKSFHEDVGPFETIRKSMNVTFKQHASSTTRYRANHAPYMNQR